MTQGTGSGQFGHNACANHPTIAAATLCGRCGDFICSACARTDESGAIYCGRCIEHHEHRTGAVPWEEREQRGFVAAWWETIMGGVFSPSTFYGQINPRGTYGEALTFMVLNTYVAVIASAIFEAVALAVGGESDLSALVGELGMGSVLLLLVAVAVIGPLLAIPFYFVQAAFLHLFCMMVGADEGGFRGTFRGMAYTSGLQFFAGGITLVFALFATAGFVLPKAWELASLLSGLAGFGVNVYSMVLVGYMVHGVHRTSVGRAIAAVVIPVAAIFLFVCGCAFVGGMMAATR